MLSSGLSRSGARISEGTKSRSRVRAERRCNKCGRGGYVEYSEAVCREAPLEYRLAARPFSHCVQHLATGRRAGGQGFQRKRGGEVRRPALKIDFKKIAAVALAQRRHGARDFSLQLRPCADHDCRQAFELPAWPFN